MNARGIIEFLVKALLLFPAILWLWESTPVADVYHNGLAFVARHTYAGPHSAGVIGDVQVEDNNFVFHVIADGVREKLFVTAEDVTDNVCVLATLYLASPFSSALLLLAWLGAAIVVLFGVHTAGLYVIVRGAIAAREGATSMSGGMVESIGPWVYPLALLLWAPYLVAYLRERQRRTNRTGNRSP